MNISEIEQQIREALDAGDVEGCLALGAKLDEYDRARQDNWPPPLRSVAFWYAQCGIPVFPCGRDKRPLTRHGFEDATTDPDKIRSWWSRQPEPNIGSPTGITFDVIDIDGEQGVQCWVRRIKTAEDIEVIGHATTSRPGGNHIYVKPSGRGNKTKILPGVDYRGKGGYVILPPSLVNGVHYRWVTPIPQIRGKQ